MSTKTDTHFFPKKTVYDFETSLIQPSDHRVQDLHFINLLKMPLFFKIANLGKIILFERLYS